MVEGNKNAYHERVEDSICRLNLRKVKVEAFFLKKCINSCSLWVAVALCIKLSAHI